MGTHKESAPVSDSSADGLKLPMQKVLDRVPEGSGAYDHDARMSKQKISWALRELFDSGGKATVEYSLSKYLFVSKEQIAVKNAIREFMAEWRAGNKSNLILFGPVGTGKGHLAIGVAAYLISDAALGSAEVVSGQEFFGKLRDGMDTGATEIDLITKWYRPEVLIISDPLPPFGPLTQYQASMLFRLVDARYVNGKRTWMTVNVADDAEADSRMGAQTWDRVCDRSWKMRCAWQSYRQPTRNVNC